MLLGELTIYSLPHAARWMVARSVVFNRISYPPLILAFCSPVHRYGPLHIYPCICSVDPCLRVLWMSTHGCFSPSFPFFYTGLSQPDVGAQELEATVDDDSYYTGGVIVNSGVWLLDSNVWSQQSGIEKGKRGSKATVSTHPKYSQASNYTTYVCIGIK